MVEVYDPILRLDTGFIGTFSFREHPFSDFVVDTFIDTGSGHHRDPGDDFWVAEEDVSDRIVSLEKKGSLDTLILEDLLAPRHEIGSDLGGVSSEIFYLARLAALSISLESPGSYVAVLSNEETSRNDFIYYGISSFFIHANFYFSNGSYLVAKSYSSFALRFGFYDREMEVVYYESVFGDAAIFSYETPVFESGGFAFMYDDHVSYLSERRYDSFDASTVALDYSVDVTLVEPFVFVEDSWSPDFREDYAQRALLQTPIDEFRKYVLEEEVFEDPSELFTHETFYIELDAFSEDQKHPNQPAHFSGLEVEIAYFDRGSIQIPDAAIENYRDSFFSEEGFSDVEIVRFKDYEGVDVLRPTTYDENILFRLDDLVLFGNVPNGMFSEMTAFTDMRSAGIFDEQDGMEEFFAELVIDVLVRNLYETIPLRVAFFDESPGFHDEVAVYDISLETVFEYEPTPREIVVEDWESVFVDGNLDATFYGADSFLETWDDVVFDGQDYSENVTFSELGVEPSDDLVDFPYYAVARYLERDVTLAVDFEPYDPVVFIDTGYTSTTDLVDYFSLTVAEIDTSDREVFEDYDLVAFDVSTSLPAGYFFLFDRVEILDRRALDDFFDYTFGHDVATDFDEILIDDEVYDIPEVGSDDSFDAYGGVVAEIDTGVEVWIPDLTSIHNLYGHFEVDGFANEVLVIDDSFFDGESGVDSVVDSSLDFVGFGSSFEIENAFDSMLEEITDTYTRLIAKVVSEHEVSNDEGYVTVDGISLKEQSVLNYIRTYVEQFGYRLRQMEYYDTQLDAYVTGTYLEAPGDKNDEGYGLEILINGKAPNWEHGSENPLMDLDIEEGMIIEAREVKQGEYMEESEREDGQITLCGYLPYGRGTVTQEMDVESLLNSLAIDSSFVEERLRTDDYELALFVDGRRIHGSLAQYAGAEYKIGIIGKDLLDISRA